MSAPCTCGRPSWGALTDLAVELQQLREVVFDEDVELLAVRLAGFRKMLDGSEPHSGYHRGIAREVLAEIAREDRESGRDAVVLDLASFADDNIDFRRPGDVRDVDPADVLDFPALSGVAPEGAPPCGPPWWAYKPISSQPKRRVLAAW